MDKVLWKGPFNYITTEEERLLSSESTLVFQQVSENRSQVTASHFFTLSSDLSKLIHGRYGLSSTANNLTTGSVLYLTYIFNTIKLRDFIEKTECKRSIHTNSYHSKNLILLLVTFPKAHIIIIMCLPFLYPFLVPSILQTLKSNMFNILSRSLI